MKKGQIVSALMACASNTCSKETCPYWGPGDCTDKLMIDAAECIVRLFKDNMNLAAEVREVKISRTKAKLNSLYGEMHNADENDNV